MNITKPPRWLEWAREIQALAQTGYHYSENEYQRERYHRLTEIAAEIISEHSELPFDPLLSTFNRQIGYATPRVDVRGATRAVRSSGVGDRQEIRQRATQAALNLLRKALETP